MFWNGFLLGLSLSFVLGPLFFAVVQTSLQHGQGAGLAMALGMWIGDVLYIAAVVGGVEYFAAVVAWQGFSFYASIGGGVLLILFGLSSFYGKKGIQTDPSEPSCQPQRVTIAPSHLPYLFKGFVLNAVNPGTMFFWLGLATTVVLPGHWGAWQATTFFVPMLATLVLADLLKIYGAQKLKAWLTPGHIRWVNQSIGVLLVGFGVLLLLRLL